MARHANRRRLLTSLAAGVAAPAILRSTRAYAQDATIKVGYVSPRTGPLAGFVEADDFVLGQIHGPSGPRISADPHARDARCPRS